MFYAAMMNEERLFELGRRTFDTPGFRGLEFIEVEAKSIINHVPASNMPFQWTINPYRGCSHACVYCFARPTHTFMEMNAGRDFETKIVVKVNAAEVLRSELRARRWKGDHIAMGTATDPYQRAEGKYRLMPGIIKTLTEFRNPFSILTKGTLILRDLDLLVAASHVADVSTALSIPTLDDEAWKSTEPGTPHPRKRMEAVARLNQAGIPCGVMMMPILPGLTDHPSQLQETVEAAVGAGATFVTAGLLHLRPVVREHFLGWLQREHPALLESYEERYPRVYASPADRKVLGREVEVMVRRAGGTRKPGGMRPDWRKASPAAPTPGSAPAEQLSLI